jgi:hypothetical protein
MGIAAPDRPHPGIHSGRLVAPPVELTRRRLLGGAAARGAGMLLASCGTSRADPTISSGGTRTRSRKVSCSERASPVAGTTPVWASSSRKPALACSSNQDGRLLMGVGSRSFP